MARECVLSITFLVFKLVDMKSHESIENNIPKISVIIPVYNVFDYIDQCMDSVVNQSLRDFEVILINDGSTDGSEKKCEEWAERDSRIRYYSQENEGVHLTRNTAVQLARGEWLSFVDPDDWCDKDYLDYLYNAGEKNNADMVQCDFWRYNNITGEKTYRSTYGEFGNEYERKARMIYGVSTLWTYIVRRKVWISSNIVLPDCVGSAHIAFFILLAEGINLVSVRKPLYYYRRLRKGSIVDSNAKGTNEEGQFGIRQLQYLKDELENRGLMEEWHETFERAVKRRLTDFLTASYLRREDEEFLVQENSYYDFITKSFPNCFNDKYVSVGGYNLSRILSYLPNLNSPFSRFGFSSIVSIMNPAKELRFRTKNTYRRKMIQRDMLSSFWKMIETIKPQWLFIDLIEERFDIIQLNDGGYLTYSDALMESDDFEYDGRLIKRNSDECAEVWKENCQLFFERIQKYINSNHIVIIENYLSENYGNSKQIKQFDNPNEIKEINEILDSYYSYLRMIGKDFVWIDAYNEDYYYTDIDYEYGVIPSHLNGVVNKQIAEKIYESVRYGN